jgi:hypothetical protein
VAVQFNRASTGTNWALHDQVEFLVLSPILTPNIQVGIPEPPIMELSVRGATNTYTNNGPNSGDTEMALDMQARPGPQRRSFPNLQGALGPTAASFVMCAPDVSLHRSALSTSFVL